MDNQSILQLITSDSVFLVEILAFFAIGFYLIVSIAAFPKRVGSLLDYSNLLPIKPDFQMEFKLATVVGVGAVMSPPRTWLRQNASFYPPPTWLRQDVTPRG